MDFQKIRTVAVVGISNNPERPSYRVADYLQQAGYRIIPVNPGLPAILGETCYANLTDIPAEIQLDVVDIFRRSTEVLPIVREAVARPGVKVIWMQEGVVNQEAATLAREAGIEVLMDSCIAKEHQKLNSG